MSAISWRGLIGLLTKGQERELYRRTSAGPVARFGGETANLGPALKAPKP
jgi:hypothetical protein